MKTWIVRTPFTEEDSRLLQVCPHVSIPVSVSVRMKYIQTQKQWKVILDYPEYITCITIHCNVCNEGFHIYQAVN